VVAKSERKFLRKESSAKLTKAVPGRGGGSKAAETGERGTGGSRPSGRGKTLRGQS